MPAGTEMVATPPNGTSLSSAVDPPAQTSTLPTLGMPCTTVTVAGASAAFVTDASAGTSPATRPDGGEASEDRSQLRVPHSLLLSSDLVLNDLHLCIRSGSSAG